MKQKGIGALIIFSYLLSLVFRNRSLYMDLKQHTCPEEFSKNTVYRFLNNESVNWERFQTELAAAAVRDIECLTGEDRRNVFIIDDTIYKRDCSKKVELLSKVYDHSDNTWHSGFRALALAWSDGNTLIPVRSCLLASGSDEKIVGTVKPHDGRTLAAKRCAQARRKATDVTVELLQEAKSAGIHADLVLFDSWFFSPKMACRLKQEENLDLIAMAKKSTKIHYGYEENGERLHLDVKQIYARRKKRPGRARWLLSVPVKISADEDTVDGRLVFVRNRNKRKEWLVLVTTDMTLTEEEIIRLYGKRWAIETFFKACKQHLRLTGEFHSLSYSALCAHLTIVLTRYILLALEQRSQEDIRTLGELFLHTADELQDLTFAEALDCLVTLFSAQMDCEDAQIQNLLDVFISSLPVHLRSVFAKPKRQAVKTSQRAQAA